MEHQSKTSFQKKTQQRNIKRLDNYIVAIGGEKAVKAVKQSLW
jgi:hypothetical protein